MEDFGTHPKFMHRRLDPGTSIDAAYGVDSVRLEERVWKAILSFGKKGAIHDQVAEVLVRQGVHYDSIAPRYSALINKGYIKDTGDTGIGISGYEQRVMVGLAIPIKPTKTERKNAMATKISGTKLNTMRKAAVNVVYKAESYSNLEVKLAEMVLELVTDILNRKLLEVEDGESKA